MKARWIVTLTIRRLIIVGLIGAVILLANTWAIASWLSKAGLIGWAQRVRVEYLTGTAVTLIVVFLLLLGPATCRVVASIRRCPVCDRPLARRGKYCPECGSRV